MTGNEIFIFYGSQTGQAETIAELIHEATEEHGIKSTLMSLWKSEEAFRIVSEGRVPAVFLCSTTGDGELPATARKFMRILSRKTYPTDHLSKLRYALLGLGDSNYSTFCGGPKTLEKGLKKLGAESFYPTGYADDGTDLEIVVEPWIAGLWPVLKAYLEERKSAAQSPEEKPSESESNTEEKIEEITETLGNTNIHDSTGNRHYVTQEQTPPVREQKLAQRGDEIIPNSLETPKDTPAEAYSIGEMPDSKPRDHLDIKSDSLLTELSEISSGTLPPPLQRYLSYETLNQSDPSEQTLASIPCAPYPIAADEKFCEAAIKRIKRLTKDNAVKTAFCVTLELPEGFSYEPGDSFGVFVQNPDNEVNWLAKRLNLESDCDKTIQIVIDPNTKKKNAKIPSFIPSVTTMRHILQNCLEIRSVPKRTFLRALHDFTSSERDKNILTQLSRKESMEDFVKYVREPNLNILDILAALPSCQPPFMLLVEHLPRLKARQYSVASSLAAHPGEIRFVFNLVNFEPIQGRMYARNGLATGYLSSLASELPIESQSFPNLTIFRTKNNSFRLPTSLDSPIIMVGPGTGVAPYIGFLESLSAKKSAGDVIPETWLFYGCRHRDRDFLFENEMETFVTEGVLSHLVVAFSRDIPPVDGLPRSEASAKYVQDNLKIHANEIADLLLRNNATFYVCGDARNMSKDVRRSVLEILSKEMPENEALESLKKLSKDGRYKEDVWT